MYDRGIALRTRHVVLIYLWTEIGGARGAVVASRKVGNSVRRNRAKRLLRTARRHALSGAPLANVDHVLVAREGIDRELSREIDAQVIELYTAAGLLPGINRGLVSKVTRDVGDHAP